MTYRDVLLDAERAVRAGDRSGLLAAVDRMPELVSLPDPSEKGYAKAWDELIRQARRPDLVLVESTWLEASRRLVEGHQYGFQVLAEIGSIEARLLLIEAGLSYVPGKSWLVLCPQRDLQIQALADLTRLQHPRAAYWLGELLRACGTERKGGPRGICRGDAADSAYQRAAELGVAKADARRALLAISRAHMGDALEFALRAARQGVADGMALAAAIYDEQGDKEKARFWYDAAARHGHEKALEWLNKHPGGRGGLGFQSRAGGGDLKGFDVPAGGGWRTAAARDEVVLIAHEAPSQEAPIVWVFRGDEVPQVVDREVVGGVPWSRVQAEVIYAIENGTSATTAVFGWIRGVPTGPR